MKLNKILATALLLGAGFSAQAQETVTEYKFVPHWFLQAQIGGQETLGEASFGKLLSPNAQLAGGYQFNPYIGARLAVNAWQSKGHIDVKGVMYNHAYTWKWNYVAPTVDVMFNMTNILGGYNPTRLVDVNVYGGIGVNIAFNNKEAQRANADYAAHTGVNDMLQHLWSGTKTRFVGQFGADVNFNITDNWAVGLELMANVLPDTYNSKKAPNADWYFNGLVGVKYTFGNKYNKQVREIVPETVVEYVKEVVHDTVYIQQPVTVEKKTDLAKVAELRRDIFFKISTSNIVKAEMSKVQEVAQFLKENPDTKVTITGYADRGTGTPAINARLCKKRAEIVKTTLINKFGIPASRIITKVMDSTEAEPYSDPVQNRVAIAICR